MAHTATIQLMTPLPITIATLTPKPVANLVLKLKMPISKSIKANNNINKNLEFPAFAQSRVKVNNAKITVKLLSRLNIGVSVGISTPCFRRDAKLAEDYAREFYLIDCQSGIFSCNNYNIYLREWPKKCSKGDSISMQLIDKTLFMFYNGKYVAQITAPNFEY